MKPNYLLLRLVGASLTIGDFFFRVCNIGGGGRLLEIEAIGIARVAAVLVLQLKTLESLESECGESGVDDNNDDDDDDEGKLLIDTSESGEASSGAG